MPIVNHNGRSYRVPFDPDIMARLIFEGVQVQPDPDTPPDQLKEHQSLIQERLKSLWGDSSIRTTPGQAPDMGKAAPGITEGETPKMQNPAILDFRQVNPNPGTMFNMPQIEQRPWDVIKQSPLFTRNETDNPLLSLINALASLRKPSETERLPAFGGGFMSGPLVSRGEGLTKPTTPMPNFLPLDLG